MDGLLAQVPKCPIIFCMHDSARLHSLRGWQAVRAGDGGRGWASIRGEAKDVQLSVKLYHCGEQPEDNASRDKTSVELDICKLSNETFRWDLVELCEKMLE